MRSADRDRVIAALESEGLLVTEWHDEANASYPEHSHADREVRVVLQGGMTIRVGAEAHELQPGDRIDLPPGAQHSALVGPHGVRYLAGTGR